MNVIFRSLLPTHSYISPTFYKNSRCLYNKQRRFDALNVKYASTAKFPDLSKDHPEINSHEDLYKFSIENPAKFWDYQATRFLTWKKPYSSNKIMDCDMKKGIFKWFEDGQLNASVNCVDR